MCISPISVSFGNKSSSNVICYDDSISANRRKYIRDRLDAQIIPPYTRFNDRMLEEYELKKLIESLSAKMQIVMKPNSNGIDSSKMNKINLYNVSKIPGMNSYRGAVGNIRREHLKLFKEAGIKRVIALAGCSVPFDEFQKNNIEFLSFPLDKYEFSKDAFTSRDEIVSQTTSKNRDIYGFSQVDTEKEVRFALEKWQKNKEKFISQFVNFINAMQKDNVYIGCEFGTWATDHALKLNYFFNPKAENVKLGVGQFDENDFYKYQNLYNNLTPEAKNQMGWDKDFDEQFIKRLKNMLGQYC